MHQVTGTAEYGRLLGEFEATRILESPNVQEFARLLDEFARLPPSQKRPKTLLEITGFPHEEAAYSNLLKFLLDPKEEHGLGDLVLRSLLEAAELNNLLDRLSAKRLAVRREDVTKEGKRMDIVVDSERFVLVIENKIRSGLNNPFDEYRRELESMGNGTNKIPKGILLSLHKEKPREELFGFIPVTYDQFFAAIRKNVGTYLLDANDKHLFYLMDFMATLENLKLGTHMDAHLIEFFRKNQKTANQFYRSAVALVEELKARSKPLKKMDWPKPNCGEYWEDCSYDDNSEHFFCDSWCDLDLGGGICFGLQAMLKLDGWEISSYAISDGPNKAFVDRVENLMQEDYASLGIYRRDGEADTWVYKTFPYEESAERVKEEFQKLLNLVTKHLRQGASKPRR